MFTVRRSEGWISSTTAVAQEPPNVILILADDLGYREVGAYGQELIRTPVRLRCGKVRVQSVGVGVAEVTRVGVHCSVGMMVL